MLLRLHVVSFIAVVVLREDEFENRINSEIFGLWFLLQFQKIVNGMAQENVSLYDFVTFNVKLVQWQTPDPVVIEPLPVRDNKSILVWARNQVIDKDPLKQTTERKPGWLRVSLSIVYLVLILSLACFQDLW